MKRFFLTAMIGLLTLPTLAMSDIITQWNFNSNPPDNNTATGTLTPSTGSGTISLIGGTTATFAGGTLAPSASTDPAPTDNSAWNVTNFAAGGNHTRGIQGFVNTTGYTNISVRWDQRHSNSASKFVAFFYTLDNGTTWTQAAGSMLTAGTVNGTLNPTDDSINGDYFEGGSGDRFHNLRNVNLSSIGLAGNNSGFGFRVVASFGPSASSYTGTTGAFATNGTWRFDMFTVEGTAIPEPAAASLLGLLSLALVGYRRRS